MYLGLDIGTSGVKAILVDAAFDFVASSSYPLDVSRPRQGWSEQAPDDWITACDAAIQKLSKSNAAELEATRAIGLAGQMHGAVLLDRSDRILRPCILWNDSRSHAECTELEEMAPFREICGNIVMPGFTAPKLRWVEKHEADVYRLVRRVLLPKDYVRLWLTGEHVSEMSDAAGTLWLDVAGRHWSGELLGATGLSSDRMPRLVEGTDPSGHLRSTLADRWNLNRVPVAGGGGDNAATACGMGLLRPGTGLLSVGTSGVLLGACDTFSPNTDQAVHTFCHAIPDMWYHMGVVLAATDSLAWLGRVTGRSVPELVATLPERISKPSPVLFLPYLSGERTPHNISWPAGTFTNLSMQVDTCDLVQAVLEGVGYALSDCKTALETAGTGFDRAFAVGGGARSRQWLQILANTTGLLLQIPVGGDYGASFGAAKLASACLAKASLDEVLVPPAIDKLVCPSSELREAYSQAQADFAQLFDGVQPIGKKTRTIRAENP